MNRFVSSSVSLLSFVGFSGLAHAQPDPTPGTAEAQPAELAPAAPAPRPAPMSAPADGPSPGLALPRESAIETPLSGNSAIVGSAFGGYGEITLDVPAGGESIVDFRRFVLFFGHDFNEHIRFYSELEVEHAIASAGDLGEVEVEQGYLDGLFGKHFNLRGGLVLMPMGIVNVYHEPPSFNGVDRPDVDQFVIPSTWREPAVGIFGELTEGLRYQLYVVNGFNANGFSAEVALKDGHQEAQLAHAADVGAILRVDYEPVLGAVFGASAYGATSGNTLTETVGHVPVAMFDLDARYQHHGLSARAELAVLFIGDTEALNTALASDPVVASAGPVSQRSQGGYAELGYDVLRFAKVTTEQTLTAFARFDYADTQANVLGGVAPLEKFRRISQMVGLVYRPIAQVGLKLDVRRHWNGESRPYNELATAITWLF
ncbi:FlxA-like family protein [soil metagenome]